MHSTSEYFLQSRENSVLDGNVCDNINNKNNHRPSVWVQHFSCGFFTTVCWVLTPWTDDH